MVKVMIDPGHGGHDLGVSAYDMTEKALVLDISQQAKGILESEYEGVEVRLTRSNDRFIQLSDRARMARDWGADFFVSVHLNAFNGSANGIETFMHNNSSASAELREALHRQIKSHIEQHDRITDRGLKQANFSVLRNTYQSMYSVLTESLFLDNANDAELLKQEQVITDIARGHARGIVEAAGLTRKSSESENEEEDDEMKLENWQWEQMAEKVKDMEDEGLLDEGRWHEAVKNHELSNSELTWLTFIIASRQALVK
ncbi:N-acetylmuramoyl-L-alanine amidase [Salsuginibacillus halophilus]|uniref:N-acetylmuramoyl-L-alanine amidase n=1 Tax=Salsuginibacillus halophilus TaxID=517424 RepID=A0A2P8H639_9BACI|nr:N-acetylmuramoyl-L-alanine amidase [Salsuginibacillus halophilus]PSL41692.1 N-acetylmuramoyl-L-alanine amidase [Salsuginibacillus halophilus]